MASRCWCRASPAPPLRRPQRRANWVSCRAQDCLARYQPQDRRRRGRTRPGIPDEVARAAVAMVERIRTHRPDAAIQGFLVQPMAPAGKELLLGAVRDAQFGPVVMVGFGGIYVEVLRDTATRLAPVSPAEAGRMLDELQMASLLGGVRGEPPVDRIALAETIARVGQLAADCTDLVGSTSTRSWPRPRVSLPWTPGRRSTVPRSLLPRERPCAPLGCAGSARLLRRGERVRPVPQDGTGPPTERAWRVCYRPRSGAAAAGARRLAALPHVSFRVDGWRRRGGGISGSCSASYSRD